MAAETGLSRSTVGRIWRAFGLKPHLADTFKLSTDPLFIEKVRDVVGLYLDPPERALVLCVDEKPRSGAGPVRAGVADDAPACPSGAPMTTSARAPPRCSRRWTWPAALVIGSAPAAPRDRVQEVLAKIDTEVPADLDVHLICDNLSTHKTPSVAAWLEAHPRFHVHHFDQFVVGSNGPPGTTYSVEWTPAHVRDHQLGHVLAGVVLLAPWPES